MKAHNLILAGMGEPGRFARDGLQFIFSNIVVAVKAMGESEFATGLIGTRRAELSIGEAVLGIVKGIDDGFERLRAIASDVTEDKEGLRSLVEQPLSVVLVHSEEEKLRQIKEELELRVGGKPFRTLS